uniref:Uncharacterized protein n=1 Tax=Moschus moschiferus TaxID=68415 RepID=A0A8C6MIH7_MOSMO
MSSGQQQPPPPRRVTNVGSLQLTPQENESLFTFLGKKCVVSGRDPRLAGCSPWSCWNGLSTCSVVIFPMPEVSGVGRSGTETQI